MNFQLALASFFAAFSIQASEGHKLIVKVPWDTPPKPGVFITGNIPSLCHWKPDCLKLSEIAPNVYALDLPKDTPAFEFKITRGTWLTEATNGLGQPYPNQRFDLSQKEFIFEVINWADVAEPLVQGELYFVSNFYSPELNNKRTLRIWLPYDYLENSTKRFPVIYAHDGQNLFDPKTSSSGIADWNLDHSLIRLFDTTKIKQAIVVGIDSTESRLKEYDWLEQGQQYGAFLVNTLKPWIDSHLRTEPSRNSTFLMGSSMGAHISLTTLWFYPHIFSKAAALSLPAFSNNESLSKSLQNTHKPNFPIQIFMSHGTHGRETRYKAASEKFYKEMTEKFNLSSEELRYETFPYGDHFESDWARQVPEFLKFLLAETTD